MKTKNFIIAGLVGFIVDYILGAIFYGFLFPNLIKVSIDEKQHLTLVTLGCLCFGFFISFIWVKWAGFTDWLTGLKAGAIFGFFYSLTTNMFVGSATGLTLNYLYKDMFIGIIMGALVGAAVAFTNGKVK